MKGFHASKQLDRHRVLHPCGEMGDAQNGAFDIRPMGLHLLISNGEGWEHASVSRRGRMPTYDDLCWVKNQLWDDDQTVMQLHVPKADHVNCHKYCLHLWRPTDQEIPRPPSIFVGPK